MTSLGIIAGGSDLPRAVAEAARGEGRTVFIISLTGDPDDWTKDYPREQVSLGELGKALKALKTHHCSDLIFAGRVSRPRFSDLKLDTKGALAVPRLAKAALKGDDALLRAVVDMFEREGHKVLSIKDAVPSLLLREGVLGKHKPTAEHLNDAERGFQIVARMGELDIGQAVAICEGLVLSVEAAEGTDEMLKRITHLPEHLRGKPGAPRGVLVKAPQPIQNLKTDIPVIGVATVQNAAAAGLAGIAVQADGALIIDHAHVIAAADAASLFLIGVARP